MASATKNRAVDSRIDLVGVTWAGFRRMLKVRGDRRSPRIWYLDGRLTLVSPSIPHELFAERLGTVVMEVAFGLGIPCLPLGSTTWARKRQRGAVEGDKTFYLASLGRIQGKETIDLRTDPPPDLAIEVVISHGAREAMEVYRRLGVPEVWVCTRKRLRFFLLGGDGAYHESETSRSFPFLQPGEIFTRVDQPALIAMNDWLGRLRDWIRDEVLPRARGEERPGGA